MVFSKSQLKFFPARDNSWKFYIQIMRKKIITIHTQFIILTYFFTWNIMMNVLLNIKKGITNLSSNACFLCNQRIFFLSAKETVALILGIRDVVLSITHTQAKLWQRSGDKKLLLFFDQLISTRKYTEKTPHRLQQMIFLRCQVKKKIS